MENRNPNFVLCAIGCIQQSRWAVLAAILCFAIELSPENAKAAEQTEQLAFPAPEGFGQFARGGRGGDVYYVTNLADNGPGSLRHGIRTATRLGQFCLAFLVRSLSSHDSSSISRTSPLPVSAPGDGICLRDHTFRLKNAGHTS